MRWSGSRSRPAASPRRRCASTAPPRLSATAIAPLAPEVFHDGEVADPEALAEQLRAVFSEHRLSRRVRLGVANQWVVVRNLRLPAIDDPTELKAAVRFQAQEQIPMPIEQAVLDHRMVGGVAAAEGSPAQVDVVVVAARREMILALLEPLRRAGLQPVGVDLSAFGLIRALAGPAEQPVGAGEAPQQRAIGLAVLSRRRGHQPRRRAGQLMPLHPGLAGRAGGPRRRPGRLHRAAARARPAVAGPRRAGQAARADRRRPADGGRGPQGDRGGGISPARRAEDVA